MVRLERSSVRAGLSQEYFDELIGKAASSCFGVAGLPNAGTWPRRRDVRVSEDAGGLSVELHVLAIRGLNVTMITRGIAARVRFTVEEATGLPVHTINIFTACQRG
ncbi:MAG: Asp23/Gls24 family envelope stress response protein [Oscillospiraceae bacterium]|nr:Asp23/Gls24 family envelope stress response protein [Oscillospiraceae bacterium]